MARTGRQVEGAPIAFAVMAVWCSLVLAVARWPSVDLERALLLGSVPYAALVWLLLCHHPQPHAQCTPGRFLLVGWRLAVLLELARLVVVANDATFEVAAALVAAQWLLRLLAERE
jgi:hypothetical protein